jgi:hypothetical protein
VRAVGRVRLAAAVELGDDLDVVLERQQRDQCAADQPRSYNK